MRRPSRSPRPRPSYYRPLRPTPRCRLITHLALQATTAPRRSPASASSRATLLCPLRGHTDLRPKLCPHRGALHSPWPAANPCLLSSSATASAAQPHLGRTCKCVISTTYPGKPHSSFEFPIRFHAQHCTCPGWTAAGVRIGTCWIGDALSPACSKEWATFAATLPTSWASRGVDVTF